MTFHDSQPAGDMSDAGSEDARDIDPQQLVAALRAGADGSNCAVASVELLISHGGWLARPDFRRHITVEAAYDDGRPMAFIDWDAVLAADLPASSGETRLLAIAAELDGTDTHRPLSDLITSLDDHNLLLVLHAISRAGGRNGTPR